MAGCTGAPSGTDGSPRNLFLPPMPRLLNLFLDSPLGGSATGVELSDFPGSPGSVLLVSTVVEKGGTSSAAVTGTGISGADEE